MSYTKISAFIGLALLYQTSATAWGPVPLPVLSQQADVIAVATVSAISPDNGSPDASVQLTVNQVLKGQPGALTLIASVTPSPSYVPKKYMFPDTSIGETGIWFLKLGGGTYRILPLTNSYYSHRDLFLGLPDANSLLPGKNLNQQLLANLVRRYMLISTPSMSDDLALLANFQTGRPNVAANQQDLLSAAGPLVGSLSRVQHIVGLAITIQLGSTAGLTSLDTELETLQPDSRFSMITRAIAASAYDETAIALLQKLIGRGAPGVDDAVGAALIRIRKPAVLPAASQLLNSADPNAQLKAAWFFGLFTMFYDGHGTIRDSGPAGPLSTPETRGHMPNARDNEVITPAQYAQFWLQWWNTNRTALGL